MGYKTNPTDDFSAASQPPATTLDAPRLIENFLQRALGKDFGLHTADISLDTLEDGSGYQLWISMDDDAYVPDGSNMIELSTMVRTAVEELQTEAAGEEEVFPCNVMGADQDGLALQDATLPAIYQVLTRLSQNAGLHWHNSKACFEKGYDYSLQDIQQAIALTPANGNDENSAPDWTAPVDMGRPKFYLQ